MGIEMEKKRDSTSAVSSCPVNTYTEKEIAKVIPETIKLIEIVKI